MTRLILALLFASLLTISAAEALAPKRIAFATLPPIAYILQEVAGEGWEVHSLIESGQDHESFSPSPKLIQQLGKAELFATVNAPFEEAVVAKLKGWKEGPVVVDLSAGVEKIEGDPHLWTSPLKVISLAQNLLKELQRIDPDPKEDQGYSERFNRLSSAMTQLHRDLNQLLFSYQSRPLLVYHPAFTYFAKEYNLRQIAVEVGGREPSPKQLKELIALAQQEKITTLFVEPQFHGKSAEVLAKSIGATIVELDPLAANWAIGLREVGERVAASLPKKKGPKK